MLTAIKRYNVDSMGLMTIAGTETFSHDAMGNPTSYASKTLTWNGKQLIRYYYQPGKNELYDYTYAYDENGLRTQKVLNGVTTSYYYNGSVLMGMVTGSGNTAIHQLFSYDSSGNVVSVDYSSNGGSTFTTYYYLRNAQNDIVKIIDGSGNTVVQYTYDSWGKPISTTGSLSATLGANQPFRYRGYVYDAETGWYYLQSRYYDPSVGRFVSADVLLSTGQGIIGHNSYAYCLNNPIRYMDEGGESAAEALSWWTTTMWWLTAIDGPIPAGDIIYAVVMLVLGVATATASAPAISIPKVEEQDIVAAPPLEKDDDDGSWYCGMRVSKGGNMYPVTGLMDFEEALAWALAAQGFKKSSNWGLYTEKRSDAERMMLALGAVRATMILDEVRGCYPHFHFPGRKYIAENGEIFDHFHVWYGDVIN